MTMVSISGGSSQGPEGPCRSLFGGLEIFRQYINIITKPTADTKVESYLIDCPAL